MRATSISDVKLGRGGFQRRVVAALSVGAGMNAYGKIDTSYAYPTGRWLDQLEEGVRGARNALAHGREIPTWACGVEFIERLQDVVRRFLRVYLAFATRWPTTADAPQRFGLDANTSLAGAFNRVLESRSRDEDPADDLLAIPAAAAADDPT